MRGAIIIVKCRFAGEIAASKKSDGGGDDDSDDDNVDDGNEDDDDDDDDGNDNRTKQTFKSILEIQDRRSFGLRPEGS